MKEWEPNKYTKMVVGENVIVNMLYHLCYLICIYGSEIYWNLNLKKKLNQDYFKTISNRACKVILIDYM